MAHGSNMSSKMRIKILTGQFAGGVYEAVGCNGRPHPDIEYNSTTGPGLGDGIYIVALGLRIKKEHNPNAKHCGHSLHYEDLVIPFDRFDNEIFVGDKIHAAVGDECRRLVVKKIGTEYHVGCGWMQRKLTCTDLDSGKTVTINKPARTIKIIGDTDEEIGNSKKN